MTIPVLFYHKIDFPTKDVKIRGAYTSPFRFERQMVYLKRNGFTFFTASEMIEHFRRDGRFPTKAISVTFDDGWKDNFTNAFPILRKLDIRPTIFLVTSCIGRVSAQVTAEGEGAREHLSSKDIREMAASGFEFGSHSVTHRLFDRISEDEIQDELARSKRQIEELVQKECKVFSYPAGIFSDFAKSAAEREGYIAAFSTIYGDGSSSDLYSLNRIEIMRRDRIPFRFSNKIRSIG